MKYIIVILFILGYKFSLNLYYYKRCRTLHKKHTAWGLVKDENNDENNNEKKDYFITYKQEILSLFKRAGIQSRSVSVMQLSMGLTAKTSADVFLNFPSMIPDIFMCIDGCFFEAIGVYRSRMWECINPLYWIDLIVFAPKHILQYIGLDLEKPMMKLCNVILSFVWWGITVVAVIFKEQLKAFIINLFEIFP